VICQAATIGTGMITVFHAALPLVDVMAFGVGCCTGMYITAGAVSSEWTVDSIILLEAIGNGEGTREE